MVRFLFALVLVGAALGGLLAGSLTTGAAVAVRLRMMPSTRRREGRRATRVPWRPPRLYTLERVIPVVQSRTCGQTELILVSIECYEEGFLVNYIVRGGPSPPRPKLGLAGFHRPELWWEASDDAGVVYEGMPSGGGGGAGDFRGSASFGPRLNPAASVLHLRVEEVQWLAHGPGQRSSVEAGPWQFEIALT